MRRAPRPLALALVALISATATGCGAKASSDTGGGGAGAGTPTHGSASTADKGIRFAACIRAHGVPHFPDPDAKGDYVFGIDVAPAVWQQAVQACKALEPPGALSGKRSPKQQSDALRFAACVRAHGVKDFPDPANGAPLVDTTKIPSSNRPGGMTILNAAMQSCGAALGLAPKSSGGTGG